MSSLLKYTLIVLLTSAVLACADRRNAASFHPPTPAETEVANNPPSDREPATKKQEEPVAKKNDDDDDDFKRTPLLWEKQKAESVMWSTYAMQIIGDEAASKLLPGTKDIENFCPKYHKLERDQRINFWAYLISAVAKYESSFKPTTRMLEKGLGTDPVTKAPVYSEGLLQLSYQDARTRDFCKFDWAKDKHLAAGDPKKTILDPFVNLKCGIHILANQVQSRKMISIMSGAYWSVLRPPGETNSKVLKIQGFTRKLTFC